MEIPEAMNVWAEWEKYTTVAAMYEALAEECIEVAHVAQKTARALRGENPTPFVAWKSGLQLTEEFTDLISCAIALGLEVDDEQSVEKFRRMQERHAEAVGGRNG